MKYRSLTLKEVERYVAEINSLPDGANMPAPPAGTVKGIGIDSDPIVAKACNAIQVAMKKAKSKSLDGVEGALALDFYRAMLSVGPETLNDLGFWRYVATKHLRDFVIWRDGSKSTRASAGGFGARKSTSSFQDCVPYRMFRRGQIGALAKVQSMSPQQIASIEGTDLWRSHVLRINLGNSPTAAAVFLMIAEKHRGGEVALTDLVREAAKLVQRINTNVLMGFLDEEDAIALIKPEFVTAGPLAKESRRRKEEEKKAKKLADNSSAKPKKATRLKKSHLGRA
jgi:hypothetical protein